MLTNYNGQQSSKRLKQSFFMTQMSLMNNSVQLPFSVHLILIIAAFFLNISIFFLSNPLQPQVFNQSFNNLLIPKFSEALDISESLFKILFIFNGTVLIVLFIIHMRGASMTSFFTKLLHFLMIQHLILLVPKTHLVVVDCKQNLSLPPAQILVVDVTYALLTVVVTIIVGLYVFLKIRPFRKKTLFWSLNNSRQFYSYVANVLRVLIVVIDGRTSSFLIISFVFEVYLRLSVQGYLTRQARKLQSLYSNLTLSVHVALLVCDFTSSPILACQILAFLLLLSLINFILSIYSIFNQQRYFPLCDSQIHQYYDFYFHFSEEKIKANNKVKMSVKKGSQSDKILSVHTLNCQSKNCQIKNVKFSPQTYCEDLQNLSSDMMFIKSQESVDSEIIYQLWRFQTGNKYKFIMQNKENILTNQYVIYCALNLSRFNETSDAINEQNFKSLKSIFYDKLQNCLENFSMFYAEIAKTQPKLDTLLHVGGDVKKGTNQLKDMYSQLLKHSVINFKTAQVYVQFENFFLKECNINEQSIDRLKKIQKSKQADHIEQIYIPTLTSYSQTGLIQNMNTECLSFFRLTRFQMKSKSLGSLFYPQIDSVDVIKDKLRASKKKLHTFFNRGDQVTYGSIGIKQKYIQNRKFDVVSIQKTSHSDFKNVILINKDTYEIEALLKQETFIRPNLNFHNHLLLKWRYLYHTYLMEKVGELIDQRIIKIKVEEFQNSLFVMNIDETIDTNLYIINVKFIKNMENKRNRVSSFMVNQPEVFNQKKNGKFHFFYDFQAKSDSLCLYGMVNDQLRYNKSLSKPGSLGKLQKELNSMLIIDTLLVQNRYSKGIKSYRLYDGQIYNIDLEDKQKYVQQFQGEIFNTSLNSHQKYSQADIYLIAGIFFMLILLGTLNIVYTTLASYSHKQVVVLYSNIFRIQQLRLQMNRMISIMRDMKNNHFDNIAEVNWKDELMQAYQKLKDLRSQALLFESSQIVVAYRNISYAGTLNQIIDVMISHIYEMTLETVNLQQIIYLHDTYIGDVNGKIIQQKINLVNKLNVTSEDFAYIGRILFIIGIVCIFIFYLLLATLIVVLNDAAKKKLNTLMLMSDTEARMNQAMADKLKYAVDMIKKNFDLDLKTILGLPQTHKHRKKPKKIVIGFQKKIVVMIAILICFSLHVLLYYQFTNQVPYVLTAIKDFQFKGESLIQTYSTFTQSTNRISHFSYFDPQNLRILRQKINYLAINRKGFSFDSQTNQLIDLVFYENGCQYLNENKILQHQKVPCQVSLPNYIIDNPFELGMIAYFSRAHYNILDNITDTYGCTGMYSGPFISIFARLTENIRSYGLQFIEKRFNRLTIYNVIYYIMELFYICLTLLVIYKLKSMNKQIIELLKFLNYANVPKNQNKKQGEKVKHDSRKNVSIKSITEQDSLHPSQGSQRDLFEQTSKQNIG